MILHVKALLLATLLVPVFSQDCETGWKAYNNKCWYFSDAAIDQHAIGMTWWEAESYCQTHNGHLASFATIDERDWVYDSYLVNWDDTRWWIGFNDLQNKNNFEWSDGTPVDDNVLRWKLGEPSNSGKEDCVEMWVDQPLYTGQWNDNNCDKVDPFICKADPGAYQINCPVGWVLKGQKCYKTYSTEASWHEAEVQCKAQGSYLVSLASEDEQKSLESLISSDQQDYWIGYSDQATPGTLKWDDPVAQESNYQNWGSAGQPNSLPYLGSTCVVSSAGINYQWTVAKCSVEHRFVCQKGLNGMCPEGWTLLGEKCYEFIINENRLETWNTALEVCQTQGAKLLKIENSDQQTYVSSVLQQFQDIGFDQIWLGGSDLAIDETFAWADGTPIKEYFWDGNMPDGQKGRDDCMTMYTGKTSHNWETSTCFYEKPFICELPEGTTNVPGSGTVTVEGKCEQGWRHFKGHCYMFGQDGQTQIDAQAICLEYSALVTSIIDEDEMSFIVGHLQTDSWIGLRYDSVTYFWYWMDGQTSDFRNWKDDPANSADLDCAYTLSEAGEWVDANCSELAGYICKKTEIPTVPTEVTPPTGNPEDVEKCGNGDWFSDPSTTQCYYINPTQLRTWDDARYACQSIGGDLAGINSPEEQSFLHAATSELATVSNMWIGGYAPSYVNVDLDVTDGGWRWSDGSPFNYINWASGEPNNQGDEEDCAEFYVADGFWNDKQCLDYRHYMCEKTGNANGIGTDIEDDNCKSNEACCFKHLGVEFGGSLVDSALSASTEADQWFVASRGRLNTPADIIIISDDIYFGTGHGAWEPTGSDQEPWLQVDFDYPVELKGIITQGRNGLIQYSERQWTTSYKIRYSQDPGHTGAQVMEWEWLSDQDGKPIVFEGNSDQNTQVTNLFPRPIIARHVRCYPVTWKERAALRLEYIGCRASCLNKLGMNSGYIPDSMITASSSASNDAKQARAPVDTDECLQNADDAGESYRGWLSKTENGLNCQMWSDTYPHRPEFKPEDYPNAGLKSNYCRNPSGSKSKPWCYTTDENTEWQYCDVPTCPSYVPLGWMPSTDDVNQWVQVQFQDFFKVSGVTLYGGVSSYVSRYVVFFSDDGNDFQSYKAQTGQDQLFFGLDGIETEYMDVLREPVSTKYVRIQPREWTKTIIMQFEINGCYVDKRITCGDLGTDFTDTTFTVDCPSGCVEDLSSGLVYGTTTYTENSAMCPAAVHAGRVTNQHGGSVTVVKTTGLAAYTGSYANGIQSLDYSASHLSLTFDGAVYRCDDGWQPWNEHCYYLSPKTVFKNWHDARADCVSLGADLTSIHSSGENDFHEYIITHGDRGRDVWIGMNDLRTQNYYEWADDTTVVWTKWSSNEPNGGGERCVEIYRLFGTWNDKECESEISYICKKEKQRLPPLDPGEIQTDEGCEEGWTAFESSCYRASTDEYMFIYANRICEESNGKLVSVHSGQEQAFIHALVTNAIPPGLGYTAWIGLAAKTAEQGQLYYTWETGEPVLYTNWDNDEPDVRFSCAFPFEYKGVEYTECITFDHPAKLQDTPWCSIDPVYNGRWINCDTGYEYGCAFMDDQTGYWQIDICGQNRYYVCEKDRVGYTQPVYTTPPTVGTCATGWYGDDTTSYCYQINEFSKENFTNRLSWDDAVDFCRTQGADLVSIHSAEEAEAISNFVVSKGVYSYVYFWMGLNNIDLDSGYVWTDGSPVDYTYWNFGEPNNNQGLENCVESQLYDENSGWNDQSCSLLRNYICKIAKGKDLLPAPTFPPLAGTENDPACGFDPDGTWIRYQTDYGSDKCYMFIDSMAYGWQFSENTCITKGGHLVAIHDENENMFVTGRAVQTTNSIHWIGLRDVGGRSFYWADGSSLDFAYWGNGEPNNYYDSEGCVRLDSNEGGSWNDDNCGRLYGFVCEKMVGATGNTIPPTQQATGNCPTGFTPYGNKCYYAEATFKTWESSRDFCKSKSASLVSITNDYEQTFLNNFLYGTSYTYWIGLSDRFTYTGQFVWIDETELSYTNWGPGEPSGYYEGCVAMNAANQGYWEDNDCSARKGFVCYTDKSTSIGAPPPTQSPIGCPSDYYTSVNEQACYKLFDTTKSWSQAQQYCQSQGSGIDLASINDAYANDLLKSWFWHDVTSSDALWIGLTFSTVTSNGKTDTVFSWSDGWPTLYTNWGQNEPDIDTLISGQGCTMVKSDGYWDAVPQQSGFVSTCSTPKPFVCKKSFAAIPTTIAPPAGTCPPGYMAYNEYCYYVELGLSDANTRTWFEAAYLCEQRGGTLASFHSDEEVQAIVASTTETYTALFIGLSSNGFNGWKWEDGTAVDYVNWNYGEPNGVGSEDCVEMLPWDGTWNDISCNENRGYICKTRREDTRCSVHVTEREDCGNDIPDITEEQCILRDCCWDESYKSDTYSGCYRKAEVPVTAGSTTTSPTTTKKTTTTKSSTTKKTTTTTPAKVTTTTKGNDITTTTKASTVATTTSTTVAAVNSESGGLSGGAVAGIVIGVLVALVFVAGIVYLYIFSPRKYSTKLTTPISWSASTASISQHEIPNAETGFDNPLSTTDYQSDA